jgi:hypothetical protein
MPARSNGKKGCCVPSSNTVLFFYAFDRTLFMQVLIARFPIHKVVRDVSPVDLYIFWLVTLWLGYKIGKQVGTRGVAARERKRLGIPF